MKGTRLWQEAGSPIIRGRSRKELPFWRYWLFSLAITEGVLLVGATLAGGFRAIAGAPALSATGAIGVGILASAAALPGSALGCALGVWLCRSFGWSRRVLVPTLLGLACGLAVAPIMITTLSGLGL